VKSDIFKELGGCHGGVASRSGEIITSRRELRPGVSIIRPTGSTVIRLSASEQLAGRGTRIDGI
jgi:hypothetical protein